MSDMLSALTARLYAALKHEKGCSCGKCSGGLNAVDALARSHEQLRAERDAVERTFHGLREAGMADIVKANEAFAKRDAAVRAGEAAAAGLREIAASAPNETYQVRRLIEIARVALAAYDRALSGQTAEKEEA